MRPISQTRSLFLPALVTCLLAAPPQQPAPARTDQSPLIQVNSRLVLVDVVATDRHGSRISGLTRNDFKLKEDGKPQEIATFDAEGVARQSSPEPLPANVFTNDPAYGTRPGPITLVLLDSLNTPRADQTRMREEMLRFFLPSLGAGRWTAVFALTDKLVVLQDLTTSRDQVRAALEKFNSQQSTLLGLREQASSRESEREREAILDLLKSCGDPAQCRMMLDFYESVRRAEDNIMSYGDRERTLATLAALRTIASAVAGYPGRKNLIWVSASFPLLFESAEKQVQRWSAEDELRRTVALLGSARLAVYPVDPRGIPVRDRPEGEEEFLRRAQRRAPPGGLPDSMSTRNPENYWSTTQSTMKNIAENTGGKAFYNRNDIGNQAAMALADSSSYYTLGYYPKDLRLDGRFHRISLDPVRRGVVLRYRRGYYASSLAPQQSANENHDPLAADVVSALNDPMPATGVIFRARISTGLAATDATELPVELWLDKTAVAFQQDGKWHIDVICAVGSFSADGRLLARTARRVRLEVDRNQNQNGERGREDAVVPIRIERTADARILRFLVRENHTGLVGRIDVPLKSDSQAAPLQ